MCRVLLNVVLVLALAGVGLLPAQHLHRSELTQAPVVHAHWPDAHHDTTHAESAHDDHHDLVTLSTTIGAGPTPRALVQPAVLSLAVWASSVSTPQRLQTPDAAPGPSPPPKQTVPRAPPA